MIFLLADFKISVDIDSWSDERVVFYYGKAVEIVKQRERDAKRK